MNDKIQTFKFNNKEITFELGNGDLMVNATEMAKVFDKQTSHFLTNSQTQAFIQVLEAKLGFPCLEISRGGNNPGTWFHQKLALKFAGWLSPEFELWMIDRVDELLRHGVTAINIEEVLKNPDAMIAALTQLKVERQARVIAQQQYNRAVPILNAHHHMCSLEGLYSMDQTAKMVFGDIGRNKFIKIMREDGIFMKERSEAYQRYHDSGIFVMKPTTAANGQVYPQEFATHKGLRWLINKYGQSGSLYSPDYDIAI